MRLLVVSQDEAVRRCTASLLSEKEEELVFCDNTSQGLSLLEREWFDLILLDAEPAEAACRAVRARARALPIVLATPHPDAISETFVEQTGPLDILRKPVSHEALSAVIETLARRSGGFRARADTEELSPTLLDATRHIARDPQIILSGDLSLIPFGAILQMLQMETLGGVVTVTRKETEVMIALRAGLVDLVQGRNAGEEFKIGRYFLEYGLVTSEDIDRLLREQGRSQLPPPMPAFPGAEDNTVRHPLLGDLLVSTGRVTKDQLRSALGQQSSELIYEVLRWRDGRFTFTNAPLWPLAESAKLGIPAAALILEGFRRVDEWRLVEASLGPMDEVLVADPVALERIESQHLHRQETLVLGLVDGTRSIRQIVHASHFSSFDACRILVQLLEARLVRRRQS